MTRAHDEVVTLRGCRPPGRGGAVAVSAEGHREGSILPMHEYPIQDYAIIGNCETAALINSHGGIDWLCLPAFDAPSFFGALLDREKGGEFSIRPADAYRVERRYVEDTAILVTRFVTERGTVRLTDFFVAARDPHARFYDFTSLHPTRKLVRILELENGADTVIDLRVAARPDYARRPPAWRRVDSGFECAEAALFSSLPLVEKDGDIALRFTLEAGRPCFFVLDGAETRRQPDAEAVRNWLGITQAFWREWNLFNYYRGPHQEIIRRSAVTLKLLTYAPGGAIVAAPTTSLPERLGGDLNWDYRYTWVRDTALFINTLFRLGYSGEAKAYSSNSSRQNAPSTPPPARTRIWRCSCPSEMGHLPERRRSIILPATAAPGRCGAATAPRTSSSSTITATFCSRSSSGNTPAASSMRRCVAWPPTPSRSCAGAGPSRTTASGSRWIGGSAPTVK